MFNYPTHFKRNEEKFQCNYKTAKKLEKELKKFLIQEKFKGFPTTRIYNLSFEDLKRIDFNNYSRIRARMYYQKKIMPNSPCWIELRKIYGTKCTKKRFSILTSNLDAFINGNLYSILVTAKEIIELKRKKNVKPIVAIDYCRKAFNSEDKKLRITIDTDLTYYAPPIKNHYFNSLLGKDMVAIVKVKYEGKISDRIKKLINMLSNKPLSKLQRALYFLEESK